MSEQRKSKILGHEDIMALFKHIEQADEISLSYNRTASARQRIEILAKGGLRRKDIEFLDRNNLKIVCVWNPDPTYVGGYEDMLSITLEVPQYMSDIIPP